MVTTAKQPKRVGSSSEAECKEGKKIEKMGKLSCEHNAC